MTLTLDNATPFVRLIALLPLPADGRTGDDIAIGPVRVKDILEARSLLGMDASTEIDQFEADCQAAYDQARQLWDAPYPPEPEGFELHFEDDSDLENWTFKYTPGTVDPTIQVPGASRPGALVFGTVGDAWSVAVRNFPVEPGRTYDATVRARMTGPGLNTGDWSVRVYAGSDKLWETGDLYPDAGEVAVFGGQPLPANADRVQVYFLLRGLIDDPRQTEIGEIALRPRP